ncbi:MAG: FHA domain-containing protein [Propionibacterium sp.]|nr:FHA domain-containing protein [Propionibacterium sp.]
MWGETQAVILEDAAVQPVDDARVTQAPSGPQSLAEVDDHDSMTIRSLDDFPSASNPLPGGQPEAQEKTVVAVCCPMSHTNPTHRKNCRVCGAPLLGEPQRIPRPSLGWVRTPSGERLELVTPLVIGRNPRAERIQGIELPRLVAVPNGHVSSNHLEIRVEGWSVLAVDLHSRNGTYLRRPGQPPVRLPDQPTVIVSGDVLDLGHGVQFCFEELP